MHNLSTIYDYVRDVQDAKDNAGVLDVMRGAAYSNGYDHFIISGLPVTGLGVEPFVLAADWPDTWYSRYFERDYAQFDPVVHHCFHTLDAFNWADAPYDHAEDKYGARVMDEAADCGLVMGLCIPVHAIDGMQGCVSFGGRRQDHDPRHKLDLYMLAMVAHGRLRSLQRPKKLNVPKLSPREIEVLKWAADGKSTADIAELINVAEATVFFHFRSVADKLGTLSRVHSVATALRHGILNL